MAKTGFYVRLGNGRSKCQHVYVGNMAHARVLTAVALWNGNRKVDGQVYFITDSEAKNFFKFLDQVVAGAGYKIFPKNNRATVRELFSIRIFSNQTRLLCLAIRGN